MEILKKLNSLLRYLFRVWASSVQPKGWFLLGVECRCGAKNFLFLFYKPAFRVFTIQQIQGLMIKLPSLHLIQPTINRQPENRNNISISWANKISRTLTLMTLT